MSPQQGGDFRLSPQQRRIVELAALGGMRPFAAAARVTIEGPLDRHRLLESARAVVDRFEILRTTFPTPPGLGVPVQRIGGGRPSWRVVEAGPAPGGALAAMERQARGAAFDAASAMPLRLVLVGRDERRHELFLYLPALAADRRTLLLLVAALAAAYAGADDGAEPLQYADVAEWQNELLAGEDGAEGRQRWLRRDPAELVGAALPFGAPPAAAFQPAVLRPTVPAELCRDLASLESAAGAAAGTAWLAAWLAVLARLADGDAATVGLETAGRDFPEIEGMLGPLSRLVPLRCVVDRRRPFAELLGEVEEARATAAGLQEYFAWDLLARRHGLDLAATVLPAAFAVAAPSSPIAVEGTVFRLAAAEAWSDRFGLRLTVDAAPDPSPRLCYDRSRFRPSQVDAVAGALAGLVAAAVAAPATPVAELSLGAAGTPFAAPPRRRPRPSVPERFLEQARRTPDRVAVVAGGRHLSFGALAERCRRLAARLRRLGAVAETRVAVMVERDLCLPEAVLGVLASGAAYLPIDPSLPAERKRRLVTGATPRALVTVRRLAAQAPAGVPLLVLDEPAAAAAPPAAAAEGRIDPVQAAYVLFTSGSTGEPKGVVVEHRQLASYVDAVVERLDLPADAAYAMVSSYATDLGHTAFFPPLCGGGRLVLAGGEEAVEPRRLAATLAREPVDCLKIAPGHLRALLSAPGAEAVLPRRRLVLGGEATPWSFVDRLRERAPGCGIVNHYGPTEATVGALALPLDSVAERHGDGVPLGAPLAGAEVHLLAGGLPVPCWFPGEIHLGGAGVARGYLGQPGLTAARFVPDPWSGRFGERLYRTGDRARRLPGGQMEFLGRGDDQLKVRGFRVEPAEVEAVLAEHPALVAAAVAGRDGGEAGLRLAAWFQAAPGTRPEASELRDFLRERLPEFMVPTAFVRLERLPLTASGKLDRRALPEPEWGRPLGRSGYEPPAGRVETLLAGAWEEVLGIERVGALDDFFALGGDSIRAIVVSSRAAALGLRVSVEQLFGTPVLRDLAASLAAEADGESAPAGPAGEMDRHPLSRLQAGMLFHSELAAGGAVYHNLHSFRMRGPLDEAALARELGAVMEREPALRLAFEFDDSGEPGQRVHRDVPPPLQVHDLRALPAGERQRRFDEWLDAERRRPFEWTRPPLFACHVHRLEDDRFWFTLGFHHSILDGWSVATLLGRLFRGVLGQPEAAPAGDSFLRFVAAERRALDDPLQRRFWEEELAGAEPTLLAADGGAAVGGDGGGEARAHTVDLPPRLGADLRRVAGAWGLPVKSLLLAVHARVLATESGRRDLLTGLVTHGRPEAGGDTALGLFLNTLPLRARLAPGGWRQLAAAVWETERRTFPYRLFPLAELQRGRRRALFDTVVSVQHYHVQEGLEELPGLALEEARDYGETNFPLTVNFLLRAGGDELALGLAYRVPEWSDERARRLGERYRRALAALAADPDAAGAADLLLVPGELGRLREWASGPRLALPRRSVHDLVAERAREAPAAPAVACGERAWDRGELDRRSAAVARRLGRLGIGRGSVVGLSSPRSLEMLAGLLGILRAGAAYLPLDPAYPPQRLSTMVEDSGAVAVLAGAGAAGMALPDGVRRVDLDEAAAGGDAGGDEAGEEVAVGPEDAAYVIYTSGSTGRPKGVEVGHRALLNLLLSMAREPGLEPSDVLLSVTSLSFDIAALELLLPLLTGCRLELPSREAVADGGLLREHLERCGATVLQATPSTWRMLLASGWRGPRLRLALCGGEPLHSDLAQALVERADQVWNVYGPTETTIWSTQDRVRPDGAPVSIGRPLANTEVWVIDAVGGPCPPGVEGELLLGGCGLAVGYRGRPALTAERFVPHPWSAAAGERLYRTGDLARFLDDGRLVCRGRVDQQVKVRGFRIEPGEIESLLDRLPGVAQSAVVPRQVAGETRLVAYLVPAAQPGPTAEELRRGLAERLPGELLPALFVPLDRLPRTLGGKLDRRALPEPRGAAPHLGSEYVAPASPLERLLADLWRQVLAADRVGLDDDFFALGGDSLVAIQLMMRIKKTLALDVRLRHVIDRPTVAGLAAALREIAGGERVERTAELVLRVAELPDDDVDLLLQEAPPSGAAVAGELS